MRKIVPPVHIGREARPLWSGGGEMGSPCPRCGATKTESVRHGFIYDTAWKMGYHMRRCSDCNRWRFLRRGSRDHPHPNDLTLEQLQESFNRKIAAAGGIPPMPLGRQGENVPSNPSEQSRVQSDRPGTSSVGVVVAAADFEDHRKCPRCGSTAYRRSRRRWFERLLRRPRMARCLRCRHRFPYPH